MALEISPGFSFDAALEQMLVPLISGATVVIRGEQVWDAEDFVQMVEDWQLTIVNLH